MWLPCPLVAPLQEGLSYRTHATRYPSKKDEIANNSVNQILVAVKYIHYKLFIPNKTIWLNNIPISKTKTNTPSIISQDMKYSSFVPKVSYAWYRLYLFTMLHCMTDVIYRSFSKVHGIYLMHFDNKHNRDVQSPPSNSNALLGE